MEIKNVIRVQSCKRSLILVFTLLMSLYSYGDDPPISLEDYFPDFKIKESNDPAPGYYFLATKKVYADPGEQYVAIIDNYGTPVFFWLLEGAKSSIRLLEDGRIVFWNGKPRILTFLDDMLTITDTITTRGYKSDGHDWDISEEGNIILMGHDNHVMDLSSIVEGGRTDAIVEDIVVQEFDKDKNLLYTWKSINNFNVLDALGESNIVDYTAEEVDYIHTNSVHFDSDTSFILSSRHMNEVTKVDRRTQEIIWRFGGKNNEFVFLNDDIGFSHQHSISRTPSGTILIFDNGNMHEEPRFTSAVEYLLDEKNKTATMVRRFRRSPDIYQPSSGCTQRIHNGNTLMGWSSGESSITEFHPDGSVAAEIDYTDHSFSNRNEKFQWKTKVFETDVDTLDFGHFDGTNEVSKIINITNNSDEEIAITSYSTHSDFYRVNTELPLVIPSESTRALEISFDPKMTSLGYLKDILTLNYDTDVKRIARQVWLVGTQDDVIPPEAEITPGGVDIPVDISIVINLSKPIKILNGSELSYNTIDEYIVFKLNDENGNDISFDAIISTDKTQIRITPSQQLEQDQLYYVCISGNLSDYSGNPLEPKEETFRTERKTGIRDYDYDDTIVLYPNPTRGLFSINTNTFDEKLIIIYDICGKQVYRKISDEERIEINSSFWDTGQYIVVIKNEYDKILNVIKMFRQ